MIIEGRTNDGILKRFAPVETPNLVILIGPNGSGKSKFLQAAKGSGVVVTDKIGETTAEVQGNSTAYINGLIGGEIHSHWSAQYVSNPGAPPTQRQFDSLRFDLFKNVLPKLREILQRIGAQNIEGDWDGVHPEWDLIHQGTGTAAEDDQALFLNTMNDLTAEPRGVGRPRGNHFPSQLRSVGNHLGKAPINVTYREYYNYLTRYTYDAFFINFAEVMGKYAYLRSRNDLSLGRHNRDATYEAYLSEEDFIGKYGRSPAVLLSEALADFGIHYEVLEPDFEFNIDGAPPSAEVLFRREGVPDPFRVTALSSGEMRIYQFVVAMMTHDPKRANITYPDLLLLDEVDASFHPHLAKQWLEAVQSKLVKEKGVRCIIATHSATTVALAPEGSIYELVDGILTPVNKQVAVNRMTTGIPTLAIDFEGRRQVFTESQDDARIYQEVLMIIQSRLTLERSLAFAGCGIRKSGLGDVGNGCEVVKQVVNFLNDAGTKSVYGIVDWDQREAPGIDHVVVLSQGVHYTIENVLLDPLLIGVVAAEQRALQNVVLGDIFRYEQAELQILADRIAYEILGFDKADPKGSATYINKITIEVPLEMQTMRKKDLIERVQERCPWTKGKDFNKGLSYAVVDLAIRNIPGLCPTAFADVFNILDKHSDAS